MGIVERTSDGSRWHLADRTLLGRSSKHVISVSDAVVSRHHAQLSWSNGFWELTDLDSQNGTSLCGQFLEPGKSQRLFRGATFHVGGPDGVAFRLVDIQPPAPFVVLPDGTHRSLDDDVVCLPSNDEPTMRMARAGAECLVETDAASYAFVGWRSFATSHGSYHVFVPDPSAVTCDLMRPHLDELRIAFDVSSDEERVGIRLKGRTPDIRLRTRSLNYMLLTLARLRLREQQGGVPEDEAGWVARDALADMLRLTSKQLSVWLARANAQLGKLGVRGGTRLVAKRRDGKELRLGVARIQVRRDSGPYEFERQNAASVS